MAYLNKKTIVVFSSLVLFSSIITLIGCNKEGITESEYQIQYQRNAQLTNLYTNEILPLNNAFVLATKDLEKTISTFKQELTIQNLDTAQMQWIKMLKVWKRLELYNLGAIEDSFIHFEINRWITNIDNIDGYIEGTEILNEAFIASIGSSSKGISAIEYILFSSNNNQDVLNTFTIDYNAQRRLDYLDALSNNLSTKSQELQTLWTNDKDNFISSLESGISGTQSQLTNAMITLIEEIIISKLGNPLGDNSGGAIDAEALEAYRSETSLKIIQEHLIALNRCYEGSFIEESIKWGYDDYLTLIGRENLDTDIVNAFKTCQEKLEAITNPLHQELAGNTQNVIDLQNAFTDLLVLIKVDMANAIGTTVTINDNDGD